MYNLSKKNNLQQRSDMRVKFKMANLFVSVKKKKKTWIYPTPWCLSLKEAGTTFTMDGGSRLQESDKLKPSQVLLSSKQSKLLCPLLYV